MGYAASIYSMTRNIGGSIGTSVLTTILVRRQQIQQNLLTQHVTVFDAWRLSESHSRMPGGLNFNYMGQLITGQKQGLAMLYGAVQNQATMISLNEIYRMLSGVMVIAIIMCVLLPRAYGKAPAGGH
jgi:DHA2 family multidrug resistance protein